MDTALQWANEIGPAPAMPEELSKLSRRVALVEEFESKIMAEFIQRLIRTDLSKDQFHRLTDSEKADMLGIVANITERFMRDVPIHQRISITLRLWAGCVSAGKTIALTTRDGPNSTTGRGQTFSNIIDPIAEKDGIYRAGVESATLWKTGRKEQFSLSGVPHDSSVKKYSEQQN